MRTDIEQIWAQHTGRIKTDWNAVAKPNTNNPLLEDLHWEDDDLRTVGSPDDGLSNHDHDMLEEYSEWARSAGDDVSPKQAFIAGFEASSKLAYIAASQGDDQE